MVANWHVPKHLHYLKACMGHALIYAWKFHPDLAPILQDCLLVKHFFTFIKSESRLEAIE